MDDLSAQLRNFRRDLRQIIWMMTAATILVLTLVVKTFSE